MLSKSDLSKLKKIFASKKDLSDLEKKMFLTFATKKDLSDLERRMFLIFASKDDLRKLEEKVEERAARRHSEIFNLVDGLAIEVRDSREFRVVAGHQVTECRERLDKLENKVKSLVS